MIYNYIISPAKTNVNIIFSIYRLFNDLINKIFTLEFHFFKKSKEKILYNYNEIILHKVR